MANNFFLRHIKFRRGLALKNIPVLPKFLYWVDRIIFSCDIPNKVTMGEDVKFPHYGLGCVFHERTVIGNYCKIYQNVTIGSRNGIGPPVIGNYVLIGAGSCVLGDIKIGNNVVIGAGSVVLHDVDDNCTVAGNPARVIRTDVPFTGLDHNPPPPSQT